MITRNEATGHRGVRATDGKSLWWADENVLELSSLLQSGVVQSAEVLGLTWGRVWRMIAAALQENKDRGSSPTYYCCPTRDPVRLSFCVRAVFLPELLEEWRVW